MSAIPARRHDELRAARAVGQHRPAFAGRPFVHTGTFPDHGRGDRLRGRVASAFRGLGDKGRGRRGKEYFGTSGNGHRHQHRDQRRPRSARRFANIGFVEIDTTMHKPRRERLQREPGALGGRWDRDGCSEIGQWRRRRGAAAGGGRGAAVVDNVRQGSGDWTSCANLTLHRDARRVQRQQRAHGRLGDLGLEHVRRIPRSIRAPRTISACR